MTFDEITARWELPENYIDFLRSNRDSVILDTDDYGEVEIFGAETLVRGQDGYSYNPVTEEAIEDWDPDMVVIASASGDPFCLDLSREDSPVYFAFHGEGEWDFSEEFASFEAFLAELGLQ